jgi:hypothetical protein
MRIDATCTPHLWYEWASHTATITGEDLLIDVLGYWFDFGLDWFATLDCR